MIVLPGNHFAYRWNLRDRKESGGFVSHSPHANCCCGCARTTAKGSTLYATAGCRDAVLAEWDAWVTAGAPRTKAHA